MVKEQEVRHLPKALTPGQDSNRGPGMMCGQLRSQAAKKAHILAPLANSCVTLGKLLTLSELVSPHLTVRLLIIATLKQL